MLKVKVPGYPLWSVDRSGNLYGKYGKQLSNDNIDKYGYVYNTYNDGKIKRNIKRHRLIALTFLGNSTYDVNHIDTNKRNNCIDNLEYLSKSAHSKLTNTQRVRLPRKISLDDVATICYRKNQGETFTVIAQDYPISISQVSRLYKKWNQ